MTKSERLYADKYLTCGKVAAEDCYMGGKWCATCAHKADHDSQFRYFKHEYCTRAKK